MNTSKFQKAFEDNFKLTTIVYQGILFVMYHFVEGEGCKFQPLGVLTSQTKYGRDYIFIKN